MTLAANQVLQDIRQRSAVDGIHQTLLNHLQTVWVLALGATPTQPAGGWGEAREW